MARPSHKSECKKFIRNSGSSLHERCKTLRRLLFWCMRAKEFPRQRQHVAWTPAFEDCPPSAFVLASRIEEAPAFAHVRTDEDLDAA